MSRRCDSEVAPGVYRLGTRWVNFYLVTEGGEAVLVDAGYPAYFAQLTRLAESLGTGLGALRATIVTHHHVDHAGTAEAVRVQACAPVLVDPRDSEKVRGQRRSHPPSGFSREVWRPSMIRYLAHTVRAGGARYRPVTEVAPLEEGQRLDLPAQPRILPTRGHTAGHCSVLLEDRGVLLCGDAMVNFDYASGETGPKLHRFNEDRDTALASLAQFDDLDVEAVLFGHGDPWREGLGRALELVRSEEEARQ